MMLNRLRMTAGPAQRRTSGHGRQVTSGTRLEHRGSDRLHAMDGMASRTPLLRAFAAGQRRITTARSIPLLSPTVPWLMPQPCPRQLRVLNLGFPEGPLVPAILRRDMPKVYPSAILHQSVAVGPTHRGIPGGVPRILHSLPIRSVSGAAGCHAVGRGVRPVRWSGPRAPTPRWLGDASGGCVAWRAARRSRRCRCG
jgi:hypothetical protein